MVKNYEIQGDISVIRAIK